MAPPQSTDDLPKELKRILGLFVFTLFAYITFFGACEIYRRRGGPWDLTFTQQPGGTPTLVIEQFRLLGKPVTLQFPGESTTNLPGVTWHITYARPMTNDLPYGPIEFVDVSQLPGTLAFDAFGHLIEMIPRTLFLDGREIPWTPGTNIIVPTDGKLPREKRPRHGMQKKGR